MSRTMKGCLVVNSLSVMPDNGMVLGYVMVGLCFKVHYGFVAGCSGFVAGCFGCFVVLGE